MKVEYFFKDIQKVQKHLYILSWMTTWVWVYTLSIEERKSKGRWDDLRKSSQKTWSDTYTSKYQTKIQSSKWGKMKWLKKRWVIQERILSKSTCKRIDKSNCGCTLAKWNLVTIHSACGCREEWVKIQAP